MEQEIAHIDILAQIQIIMYVLEQIQHHAQQITYIE